MSLLVALLPAIFKPDLLGRRCEMAFLLSLVTTSISPPINADEERAQTQQRYLKKGARGAGERSYNPTTAAQKQSFPPRGAAGTRAEPVGVRLWLGVGRVAPVNTVCEVTVEMHTTWRGACGCTVRGLPTPHPWKKGAPEKKNHIC